MPSLMTHLLAAYKYDSQASVPFFIGNIAPDCVGEWKRKDKTHLRDIPNRFEALNNLAMSSDLNNDYKKGVIMHLFVDYLWDNKAIKMHKDSYHGDNWIKDYRNEIALTSSYTYRHTPWSERLWDMMEACPQSEYDSIPDFPGGDISALIIRNRLWHRENNLPQSQYFPYDFVDEFTSDAVMKFKLWIDSFNK